MHRPKRWNIAEPHPRADELAARLKTSPLLAQVLLNRGLSEADDCRTSCAPASRTCTIRSRSPTSRKAAERIAKAIRDGEKIVIYGDYDVDGITATAILWHAIRSSAAQVDFYIPHRIEEGYGLNAEAIAQICDEGAKLIVTVDCGITAIEQAEVACERGVDLIITDHHEWQESEVDRPDAEAAAASRAVNPVPAPAPSRLLHHRPSAPRRRRRPIPIRISAARASRSSWRGASAWR